jgi:hypothetical protein
MPPITAALLAAVAQGLTERAKRTPTRTTPEKLMQMQPITKQLMPMQPTQPLLMPAHPMPQQHMRVAAVVGEDMQAAVAAGTRAAVESVS